MAILSKIVRFFQLSWYDRINQLRDVYVALKTATYYRVVFRSVGHRSRIYQPMMVLNPRFISIGSNSCIRQGARIEAIVLEINREPSIEVGKNVNIEQNVHIICSSRILIGENVSIAPNCGLLDTIHPYEDVDSQTKIGDRLSLQPMPIQIGENTLIGFGTIILPNVKIGRHCVIGANSVVNKSIPDYSVAGGSPARILKRYDLERKVWIRSTDSM